MVSDQELYLSKSLESLRSARADLAGKRYNSAANRAYYAAFQAAVAVLIAEGVHPRGESWEHRFVHSQFSGKLIGRRKLFPATYGAMLKALLETRLAADYRPSTVSRNQARIAVRDAGTLVGAMRGRMENRN